MRFDGSWRLCDDGVARPIFSAAVRAQNGDWIPAVFLADVAADRTPVHRRPDKFSAAVLGTQTCGRTCSARPTVATAPTTRCAQYAGQRRLYSAPTIAGPTPGTAGCARRTQTP
jgi:hypothetical protein